MPGLANIPSMCNFSRTLICFSRFPSAYWLSSIGKDRKLHWKFNRIPPTKPLHFQDFLICFLWCTQDRRRWVEAAAALRRWAEFCASSAPWAGWIRTKVCHVLYLEPWIWLKGVLKFSGRWVWIFGTMICIFGTMALNQIQRSPYVIELLISNFRDDGFTISGRWSWIWGRWSWIFKTKFKARVQLLTAKTAKSKVSR
jgi:hypothetical protein